MLFERCHTINRKISIKQHPKYFNFRSKIQLDHTVQDAGIAPPCNLLQRVESMSMLISLKRKYPSPTPPNLTLDAHLARNGRCGREAICSSRRRRRRRGRAVTQPDPLPPVLPYLQPKRVSLLSWMGWAQRQ